MDTTTAQPPQPVQNSQPVLDSYADAYMPPAPVQSTTVPPTAAQPNDQAIPDQQDAWQQPALEQPVVEQPAMEQPVPEVTQQDQSVAAAPQQMQQDMTDTQPEVSAPTSASSGPSESLADQNIFEMLGVTTGTSEQREQFLDELQQVIWDDFIEHDVKLLLTDAEQTELEQILRTHADKSLEQQEQAVVFLEKLIPDLEDIMLEKALQLKEEMARERLAALRELHRNDSEKMAVIDQAEQQMSQNLWRTASDALNKLG